MGLLTVVIVIIIIMLLTLWRDGPLFISIRLFCDVLPPSYVFLLFFYAVVLVLVLCVLRFDVYLYMHALSFSYFNIESCVTHCHCRLHSLSEKVVAGKLAV